MAGCPGTSLRRNREGARRAAAWAASGSAEKGKRRRPNALAPARLPAVRAAPWRKFARARSVSLCAQRRRPSSGFASERAQGGLLAVEALLLGRVDPRRARRPRSTLRTRWVARVLPPALHHRSGTAVSGVLTSNIARGAALPWRIIFCRGRPPEIADPRGGNPPRRSREAGANEHGLSRDAAGAVCFSTRSHALLQLLLCPR